MTILPAYCPRCHSVFPFRGMQFVEGAKVILNNTRTNCPVCGFDRAHLSDGVYRGTKEAVEILSGPESSRAMLEALQAVAQRLKAGEISKDQAIKEAAAISPRYATLIEIIEKLGMPGATAAMLLLSIISVYLTYLSVTSTAEDNAKIVDAITQQTLVIQDVAKKQRVERERERPSSKKSEVKSPTIKHKLKRRTELNKERRARLKKRRLTHGGARTH